MIFWLFQSSQVDNSGIQLMLLLQAGSGQFRHFFTFKKATSDFKNYLIACIYRGIECMDSGLVKPVQPGFGCCLAADSGNFQSKTVVRGRYWRLILLCAGGGGMSSEGAVKKWLIGLVRFITGGLIQALFGREHHLVKKDQGPGSYGQKADASQAKGISQGLISLGVSECPVLE